MSKPKGKKVITRIIRITDCEDCPHNDHKGGFGRIRYIPVCRLANKSQPYTVDEAGCADQSEEIPDWCPLELANLPVKEK